MPYQIEFEASGVYAKFEGVCEFSDLVEVGSRMWSHPRFDIMKYELFDYLDVTEFRLTEMDVVEMAVLDRVATRNTRRDKIVVVATLPTIVEMTSHYRKSLEGEGIQFLVVSTLEEAREWLADS